MQWIKNIPRIEWQIIILYFFVLLNLLFWGEWVEEDFPFFSDDTRYLLINIQMVEVIKQMIAVLIVVYYIVPKFFSKGKYYSSVILIILVLMLMRVIDPWILPFTSSPLTPDLLPNLIWGVVENGEVISFPCFLLLAFSYHKSQKNLLVLQKEQKENELKILQTQVDPHFLFNNLNILDILIDTDTEKAKTFTRKLSDLYRYMIRHKDEDVVPLSTEWKFCQNYLFLLQQRFNGLFPIHVEFDTADLENFFIPPAAMQTLIENITKHNIALPKQPIKTWISIKNNRLIVKNNYRPKEHSGEKSGTGLENLSTRVEIMTDKKLEVKIADDLYIVKVPLVSQINP